MRSLQILQPDPHLQLPVCVKQEDIGPNINSQLLTLHTTRQQGTAFLNSPALTAICYMYSL